MQAYDLARIDFLGGLYGYKGPEIGDALAELCIPEEEDESIEESGLLNDMIMMHLHFAAGQDSTNDRVWHKVLRRCVKRLTGCRPSSSGSDSTSDVFALKSVITNSTLASSNSPCRTPPRQPRSTRSSPGRPGNEGSMLDSNGKRRKPRRYATSPAASKQCANSLKEERGNTTVVVDCKESNKSEQVSERLSVLQGGASSSTPSRRRTHRRSNSSSSSKAESKSDQGSAEAVSTPSRCRTLRRSPSSFNSKGEATCVATKSRVRRSKSLLPEPSATVRETGEVCSNCHTAKSA